MMGRTLARLYVKVVLIAVLRAASGIAIRAIRPAAGLAQAVKLVVVVDVAVDIGVGCYSPTAYAGDQQPPQHVAGHLREGGGEAEPENKTSTCLGSGVAL